MDIIILIQIIHIAATNLKVNVLTSVLSAHTKAAYKHILIYKKAFPTVYSKIFMTEKGAILRCVTEKRKLLEGLFFMWSLNLFSTLEVSMVSQQSSILFINVCSLFYCK